VDTFIHTVLIELQWKADN